MGLKESVKDALSKVATGATLALATAGLTSCVGSGAVDPLPPPLDCRPDAGLPRLGLSGQLQGNRLRIDVQPYEYYRARILSVSVSEPVGVRVVAASVPDAGAYPSAQIELELLSSSTTEGSFVLEVSMAGEGWDAGATCPMRRAVRFTLSATGGAPQLSFVAQGPGGSELSARGTVALALLDVGEAGVRLRAEASGSAARIEWSASEGALVDEGEGRASWRVPEAPGIYQIEAIAHFGDDGFAVDTLLLERKESGALG